jgi:nucleoside-diphosphate-sugar epimerase
MIRDEINPGLRIGFGEAQADVHSHPLLASVDRLESVGWSPETPMHVGLRKTVAWRRLRDNDL